MTPVQIVEMIEPIERATAVDLVTLRSQAEAGDARSQLALSIVFAHGLGGTTVDQQAALVWRARALAPRGYQPITQYTAAFNGQPSRVNIINVPRYDVTGVQMAAIERCLAQLDNRTSDPLACGTAANAQRLRGLWTDTGQGRDFR